MPSISPSTLESYLTTAYSPDCDFIDGEVLERNVGERDHSRLQMVLSGYLWSREKAFGIYVLIEQRVQTSAARFLVPDILVTLEPVTEQIITKAPFLCIEILSPEDRVTRTRDKIREFLKMGVRFVWLIDPSTLEATIYTRASVTEVTDGFLRTQDPEIIVPLAELAG